MTDLARKYRPRRFSEVVGQSHVVRALKNAVKLGRVHHAYLFSGTRGVGKTTLARLIAKAISCEAPEDGEPCLRCAPCRAVDGGSFPDLLEVDAASRTRVEETRELLESAHYAPSLGRYKIYLIDEVHMLSHHSFNALLKTLEEPPAHVKFLLATTEPHKIPTTVLSRCLKFHLKRLSARQIADHLRKVLQREGVSFEEEALKALAEAAEGSLRDALSLADQAIVFSGGEITASAVLEMLGALRRQDVQPLLEAVADGEGKRLLECLDRLEELGVDFEEVLKHLLELLHKLALSHEVSEILEDDPLWDWLRALGQKLDPETVQLYYEIALTGRRQLPWAPDPRLGVEMTLLRMLAFKPLAETTERPLEPAPKQNLTTSSSPPWHELIERLALSPLVGNIARHLTLVTARDGQFCFRLAEERRPLYEGFEERVQSELQEALSRYFGREISVVIELGTPLSETPAQQAKRLEEESREKAREALRRDPIVQKLIETFDAEIISVQLKGGPWDEESTGRFDAAGAGAPGEAQGDPEEA